MAEVITKTQVAVEKIKEVVEALLNKKFAHVYPHGANAFNVFSVSVDKIPTEEGETVECVCVHGKEIKSTDRMAITLRNCYIVYDDMSFGEWTVEDRNDEVEDIIIAHLSSNNAFDFADNKEEVFEFLTNPYETKDTKPTEINEETEE